MDRSIRKSVVRKIYKNATTLHAYLARADHYENGSCGCCHPSDSAAYKKLLRQTIVVGDLATFPEEASQSATSMKDVLESALAIANRGNGETKRTLLLLGFRQKRYSSDYGMRTMLGMENTHVNTSFSVLKTAEWEALLRRIGNARMLHLLLNTSIFLPTENGCYMQLTGIPVSDASVAKRPMDAEASRAKKRPRADAVASTTSAIEPQSLGPYSSSTKVARGGMLYRDAHVRRLGLPRSHLLSEPATQPAQLFEKIWKRVAFRPTEPATLDSLQHLLNNNRQLNIGRLLQTYTPLPSSATAEPTPATPTQERAVESPADPSTPMATPLDLIDDSEYMTQGEIAGDGAGWHSCGEMELHSEHVPHAVAASHSTFAPNLARATSSHRRQQRAAKLKKVVEHAADFRALAFSSAEVASFVKAYVRRLLPASLLGSRHNVNVMMAAVQQFITLQRHDTITLGELRARLRTSDMKWLQRASRKWKVPSPAILTQAMDQALFALLRWLFCDVIVVLVENLFYVTEAEGMFQQLVYYRRPVWRALRNQAPTSASHFVPCDDSENAGNTAREKSTLPNVRFIPKQNKLRAITNLSKKEIDANGVSNLTLNSAFQVLKSVCADRPEVFGFGVFGMDDIYRMLRAYKDRHKNRADEPFYIASLDIEQCYDMIHQRRLFELVDKLVPDEKEFLLHKYGVVYPISSLSRLQIKYLRMVTSGEYMPFEDAANQISSQYRNSVVFDGVQYVTTSKAKIMKLIEDHLFHHVINFPSQWSRQRMQQVQGVPQGSILSPLFCNIYYGAVEHELFDNEYNALGLAHDSVIIRLMDDYIMISTRPDAVKRFLEIAHSKLHLYGGRVNPQKTQVNFNVSISLDGKEIQLVRVPTDANFQWCGVNFSDTTLDVTADFSRFFRQPIASTVSRELGANPGWQIRQRMKSFMRPKCHAMLLDTTTNDVGTVSRNVYELFLVAAMRTHAYLASISKRAVQTNSEYLLRSIMELISYTTRLVHIRTSRKQLRSWLVDGSSSDDLDPLQVFRTNRRHPSLQQAYSASSKMNMCATTSTGSSQGSSFGKCSLPPNEVVRLGLMAFYEVFSRHKARYEHRILNTLQQHLQAVDRVLENRTREVDLTASNELLQSINWK